MAKGLGLDIADAAERPAMAATAMSHLVPFDCDVRFTPRKQTFIPAVGMSAKCRYCCKSPKLAGGNFLARRRSKSRLLIDMASDSLPKSPVSSSPGDEVPHMFTRKPRLRLGKIVISSAKRLLQHNLPEADIAPTESELTRSEISLLNIFSAFAGSTRATWTIEHDGTGRTELPFVLDKAKGYATRIWNSVLAEPHRIRRAGICILLSIGDCWHGCRDHDNNESNGAQFTHDVALQFGARSDNDRSGSLFP
jgi:hypothetical protein